MLALDKTHTKSSNVIDCKAVINNADADSRMGAGHEYKLFIYNLTKHIILIEDQVKSIFTEFGVVKSCERNKKGKNKNVFHVKFKDTNVIKKLRHISPIIVDSYKITVKMTSKRSKISAEFVKEQVGKKEIRNTFSKFGALKYCKGGRNGSNKNESGFFVAFEDERVNKMLIEEGSVDYHGHKILIKEVFYIS